MKKTALAIILLLGLAISLCGATTTITDASMIGRLKEKWMECNAPYVCIVKKYSKTDANWHPFYVVL